MRARGGRRRCLTMQTRYEVYKARDRGGRGSRRGHFGTHTFTRMRGRGKGEGGKRRGGAHANSKLRNRGGRKEDGSARGEQAHAGAAEGGAHLGQAAHIHTGGGSHVCTHTARVRDGGGGHTSSDPYPMKTRSVPQHSRHCGSSQTPTRDGQGKSLNKAYGDARHRTASCYHSFGVSVCPESLPG